MSLQIPQIRQGFITLALKTIGFSTSAAVLLLSGNAFAASNPLSELKQSTAAPAIDSSTRFACQSVNGQYTVMYYPESEPNQAYPWAVPSLLGGGWTPERRCDEISRRLESYRPDGLQELRTGVENGYNVICATTQNNPSCRIVLTVPPGQDPIATRDRVFENLTVADSGQQTEGVAAYQGDDQELLNRIGDALNLDFSSLSGRHSASRNGIDLRPFLDQADGGTGSMLGRSAQTNPASLNPDRFR